MRLPIYYKRRGMANMFKIIKGEKHDGYVNYQSYIYDNNHWFKWVTVSVDEAGITEYLSAFSDVKILTQDEVFLEML